MVVRNENQLAKCNELNICHNKLNLGKTAHTSLKGIIMQAIIFISSML